MKRWKATVLYRTESGICDVHHDIEELEELQDLIERGPNWDTIESITIVKSQKTILTVEEATKQ